MHPVPPFMLAGEMAALATAFLWSLSALAWSTAGLRIGVAPVICIRTALATSLLALAHRLLLGTFWPAHLDARAVLLLAASGATGAGIGDLFYFRGLVLIGPRLGTLILSLAPVLSAVMAYFAMHETLGAPALLGIAMTVGGVAWVVSEKRTKENGAAENVHHGAGVAWALAGTTIIAVGYVLSKMGMAAMPAGGVDPLSASLIRVATAGALLWILVPLIGRRPISRRAIGDRYALWVVAAGTLVGPVIGIWLSMAAIKWIQTGVATALIGTSPIMMIPISRVAYGERPTARSLLGTCLAVAGVALLVLRKLAG